VLETAQFQSERAELDAILSSGIFGRAPHLVRFLTYICEQYFEGRADQIKEYTIGVEALGRGPDFDPKKDSIVRVEAHRLRRRLSEYYGAAGSGHAIRITIPNGQYIPQFVAQSEASTPKADPHVAHPPVSPPSLPHATLELPPAAPPPLSPSRLRGPYPRSIRWPLILLAVVAASAAIFLLRSAHKAPSQASQAGDEHWNPSSTEPLPPELRILAGYHGAPFTDRQGHTWIADAYYSGGHSQPVLSGREIQCLLDPGLLKAQRSGAFRYDIPLGKGTYELHLYFAETDYGPGNPRGGGEASRTFHLAFNGVQRVRDFDPLAESGSPNRLHVRVFKDISPSGDGKLHLTFSPGSGPAFVNAIEIFPSQPGLIRPVRIVTQDRPVTDIDGRFWSADEYFLGGELVLRRNAVLDAREKTVYRGERYGQFAYHIPLALGKYRLTLHFAETWFGSPESGQPAAGARIFNVFANGVALLQNFEIAARAGVNHECIMVFDNLQPNAQGLLSLEFVPVRNYAEVNAIEVVETE
jgi:hypothetical protein